MKKIIQTLALILTLAGAFQAQAETTLFTCGGLGLSFSELNIVQKDSKTTVLQITKSAADDAEMIEYKIEAGLNDFKSGKSASVIFQAKDGETAGGARYNAGLLRIVDGQRKAFLAYEGEVHNLVCQRAAKAPFVALEANMIFKKVTNNTGDADTFLFIRKDGTTQINHLSKNSQKAEVLFQGQLSGNHPYYVIDRAEGDICPSVEIALFPDSIKGKNQSAAVRSLFEKSGQEALQLCKAVKVMDGAYVRIK